VRLTLLADVHANLPALEAVLRDPRGRGERVVCAGDMVGYYPWPNEVLDLLRSHRADCVRGDHKRGLLGRVDITWFHDDAATALAWTRERLTAESLDYLASLEDRRRFRAGDRLVAVHHGSPGEDDEYVMPEHLSSGLLVAAEADIVFLGHTHHPMVGRYPDGLVVNPGSVGQPRDGDPRASYATIDTEALTAEVRRVPYDVEAVADRVREVRLPQGLANRLREGR